MLPWVMNLGFAAGEQVAVAVTKKGSMLPMKNVRRAMKRNRMRRGR